jgi:hypothetical protein
MALNRVQMNTLAKHHSIAGIEKMSNKEIFKAIRAKVPEGTSLEEAHAALTKPKEAATVQKVEAKKDSEPVDVAANDVHVTGQSAQRVEVASPQIIMNVPAPTVNIGSREAPKWFEVAANVKDAALYMIVGAAVWQFASVKFPALMTVASAGAL